MPNVERLYNWLADEPSAAADRVLAAGLAHAQPRWSDRIIALLLQRNNQAAWNGLVSYYPRLPEEVRAKLRGNTEMFFAGIAAALKSGSAQERGGGLDAYADYPVWRISHLLPPILRDPSAPLRPKAAQLLRTVAERVYAAWQEGRGIADPAKARPLRDSVRRFGETLGDALRGIDVHLRVEVLEPCLWFCEQLGDHLWEALEKPRSRVAHVLAEHMVEWSGPNLAGFLLRAGTRPEIKRQAHEVLAKWSSPDRIAGLLRETHLLEDAAIRRGVLGVRNPAWFNDLRPDLSDLPRPLRCLAPVWVCAGGFSERDRGQIFLQWMRTSDLAVAQSLLRALAAANTAETRKMLESASVGSSALADLARELIQREKPPTLPELVKTALASSRGSTTPGSSPVADQIDASPVLSPVARNATAADEGDVAVTPSAPQSAPPVAPMTAAGAADAAAQRADEAAPPALRDLFDQIINAKRLSDAECGAIVRRMRSRLVLDGGAGDTIPAGPPRGNTGT